MNRRQLSTNQLHDINMGALDHASHAAQLMSCNYYAHACVRVHNQVNIHVHVPVLSSHPLIPNSIAFYNVGVHAKVQSCMIT